MPSTRSPRSLARAMDNVVVLVEQEPPPDDPDLLGVYDGTPLTERDGWWDAGSLPDRITIFQGPLERMCDTAARLREEIAITVVHEVAHHFGIDDEHLHEPGLGLRSATSPPSPATPAACRLAPGTVCRTRTERPFTSQPAGDTVEEPFNRSDGGASDVLSHTIALRAARTVKVRVGSKGKAHGLPLRAVRLQRSRR